MKRPQYFSNTLNDNVDTKMLYAVYDDLSYYWNEYTASWEWSALTLESFKPGLTEYSRCSLRDVAQAFNKQPTPHKRTT